MLFFNKKKEKKEDTPKLPPLPKLPELPKMLDDKDEEYNEGDEDSDYNGNMTIKLPKFPTEDDLSKGTIKDAISGDNDMYKDSGFPENIEDKIPKFPALKNNKQFRAEIGRTSFAKTEESPMFTKKPLKQLMIDKGSEPVFVRLDKFQEALKTFGETKEKVSEIENVLNEVKAVREKEDKEIQDWESEISIIKQKIEKIESDVFSKV